MAGDTGDCLVWFCYRFDTVSAMGVRLILEFPFQKVKDFALH